MTRVRALALALLFGLTDLAAADLTTGRDKLVAGDYKTAITELTEVSGKDRPTARIMLARAQIEELVRTDPRRVGEILSRWVDEKATAKA